MPPRHRFYAEVVLTAYSRATRIRAVARSSRIVLVLPDDLLKSLNTLARRKGLSRAAYIRMALTEHVEAETQPSLVEALRSPRALAAYIRSQASAPPAPHEARQ